MNLIEFPCSAPKIYPNSYQGCHWSLQLFRPCRAQSEILPKLPQLKTSRDIRHDEQTSHYRDVIRGIIIGFADGFTVHFALYRR
jgi:hypothetical protein